MKKLIAYSACIFLLASCVPYNKFQKLKAAGDQCKTENDSLKTMVGYFASKNKKLNDTIEFMRTSIEALRLDTMVCQTSLKKLAYNYEQINKTYELLVNEKKKLLEGNENEKRELEQKLLAVQNELNQKSARLQKLSGEIENKKNELDNLTNNLKNSQEELTKNKNELEKIKKEMDLKDKNLVNLQNVLYRQDSLLLNLKKNVSNALLGFENKGLTIQIKNSKVYVSLQEELLFASGSTVVDKKGAEALKNLAAVLEQNPDINIMIEGHTDNIPYKGSSEIRDNWDLSAMRATSVAKILLKNSKINPMRITVAGRGEYYPVDPANTPEARQKNRRTEIILTPKLDELFNIIAPN